MTGCSFSNNLVNSTVNVANSYLADLFYFTDLNSISFTNCDFVTDNVNLKNSTVQTIYASTVNTLTITSSNFYGSNSYNYTDVSTNLDYNNP